LAIKSTILSNFSIPRRFAKIKLFFMIFLQQGIILMQH
jgi:hypothetical protein